MGAAQSTSAQSVSEASSSLSEKVPAQEYGAQPSLKVATPLSPNGSISLKNVAQWEEAAVDDLKVQLARTVLVDTDYKSTLATRSARIADPHVFNVQLDFKTGPVTNQKSSGRCWLFATTNVLRHSIMQKLSLKEFQLSQVRAIC